MPASELTKFRKFLSGGDGEADLTELSVDTVKYATAILDKDISHYKLASFPESETQMYVGKSGDKNYSQFHFGAGEASVIATVDRIETATDNSLIIIEEIENGLHPVVVRAMVTYLENVARRKRHQIVFTTHSQDAIDQLPPEAIWESINKRVWNGQLSIESMGAITGQIKDERVIFVEDEFVKAWIENAARHHRNTLMSATKVYKAGGYPAVLKVCEFHNKNPHIKIPATAIVDGDIYDPDNAEPLPEYARYLGEKTPESEVFDYIYENRTDLVGVIRQRCLLASHDQAKILAAIESVRNSSCDPHVCFDALGDHLDFASGISIRNGMIDIFNERNRALWDPIFDFIESASGEVRQS